MESKETAVRSCVAEGKGTIEKLVTEYKLYAGLTIYGEAYSLTWSLMYLHVSCSSSLRNRLME